MGAIFQLIILLAAAVSVVAIFRKLRLSSILGYLVAGALIGPFGIEIIKDTGDITYIAELGVVLLLFIIGTELSFTQMRAMRRQVFGFGGLQIVLSGLVIGWVCLLSGLTMEAAIVIGFGLALSSTALVLQIVQEKRKSETQLGRLSLSVLLMQDLAVVPLLVLVPLLAATDASIGEALQEAGLKALLALGVVFVGGRLILPPIFRIIASLDQSEIFSAFTLLVVLGISYAFHAAGLSMPLGAFVAGLLVAETEFKHQVEADILPYKGILLGLFFMVVGMSVDISLLIREPIILFGLSFALMLGKAAIIVALCRIFHFSIGASLHAGLLLSQGGEFAFIVFGQGLLNGILPTELAQELMLVVAITMALTPLAYIIGERLAKRRRLPEVPEALESNNETLDLTDHVVICGYGRVGQTVAKLLAAEGINYIALDTDASIVNVCRKDGRSVYFGDGTRREVLQAVALQRAKAAVVTMNDFRPAQKAVLAIHALAPGVPVIARADDLKSLLKLETAGASVAISEMYEASLQLGAAVLQRMEIAEHEINRITALYRERDYALTRADEIKGSNEIQKPLKPAKN
jgi:CPA2 family monovalent cation:H+ antiporter-2